MARNFLNGLLTKISKVVTTQNYTTISQIAEATRGIEYQNERHPREPKRVKTEGSFGGQQG